MIITFYGISVLRLRLFSLSPTPFKTLSGKDPQKALQCLHKQGSRPIHTAKIENETIGENIKKERNKLGLTLDDLVRKSGVKHAIFTKIEGDFVQKPSVQTVAKIAKALGVQMEKLLK